MMVRSVMSLAAAAIVLVLSGPAAARWDMNLGLTAEDIELAKSAAREQMDDQPVGTVIEWSNPETGASGTARLVRLYEAHGYQCREIYHRFRPRAAEDSDFTTRICQVEDGSWKFDE